MKTLFSLLPFLPLLVAAQKSSKPDAFAKTINADDLKKHLFIIAGPEMEGRETATEGQRKAAAYIENEFKRLGLQPGNNGNYQMHFNVYQDSLTDAKLEVNGQAFQLDKDFNPAPGNIPATLRFSEAVWIGAGATDSIKNADLAGKLVILPERAGSGTGGGTLNRMEALRSKGVAGILTVSALYPRSAPVTRKGAQTINAFRKAISPQQFFISEAAARSVLGNDYETAKTDAALYKIFTADVLLDVQKSTRTLQSSNVMGLLPGTDLKDEYLFITSHYDHLGKRGDSVIYYGADDDGSGTVSVLELAEAFGKAAAAGKGPRRNVVFMAVSGEEKGLWGSAYYASHPVYPLNKTTADLNIDMIGRIDPKRTQGDSTNYVYVVGDDKLSSELRTISEAMNNKYTKLELDYKYNDPNDKEFIYYRSDHYNFARNGVPIIFYFNGTHKDYHRPTDTPDKINYPLMAKRAQLVFYTAWEMANRAAMLKRDRPLPELRRQF